MRKRICRVLRSKVFNGILLAAFGPAVFLLCFLGGMFVKHFSNQVYEDECRFLEYKIDAIADELDYQINVMSEIVLKIMRNEEIKENYGLKNKYNEIEVLDILEPFEKASLFSDTLFIKYQSSDRVFTSKDYTMPTNLFFDYTCGFENPTDVSEVLRSLHQEATREICLYQENGCLVFMMPYQLYNIYSQERSVFGYIVTEHDVQEIVSKLAGNIYGEMCIYYNDMLIYTQNDQGITKNLENVKDVKRERDIIEISVVSGNITVTLDANVDDYFSLQNMLSQEEMVLLSIMLFLLLAFVLFVVWWNYLPFYRVSTKYYSNQDYDKIQDWRDIDHMLGELVEEKKMNNKLVKYQFQMLRELVIYLIIFSEYSEKMWKYLALLNIKTNFSVFGVFLAEIKRNKKIEISDVNLCVDVNELSNESSSFEACWINDNCYAILVGTDEEYHLDDAEELIKELFYSMGVMVDIKLIGKSYDLNTLHQSCTEAKEVVYDNQGTGCEDDSNDKEDLKNVRARTIVKQVMEYIEINYSDYNMSLGLIASAMQLSVPYLSTLFKKEIGISYKEYLIDFRIEKAKVLLNDPTISVTEVCRRIGYVKVSYFIKIFQEHTGMTPSLYQMQCMDKNK